MPSARRSSVPASSPASPSGQRQHDARWPAFAVCLGAGFMTLLDVTIVNVALPSIETSLEAGPSELQWILAGYTLAFGLALVPAGRLGDVYGRRTLFLVGLAAFVVTSAACGLVDSGPALAGVRFAQGLAAGVLNPQVIGFIQDLFSGPERGRAFGYFGATIGVSTAIGPLAGGGLLAIFGEGEGWRAVFLVNVPIGLVLLPLAWKLLPRPEPRPAGASRGARLDVVGSLLLAAAVVAIMWPFVSSTAEGGSGSSGEAGGGGVGTAWWAVAVGVALVGVLVWWERRVSARGGLPLIPGNLLRVPSFTFGVGVSTLYFLGFTGIWLASTLWLQSGLGLTPLQAGLVLTPFSISGAVAATLGGRWISRFGRPLVVGGIAVTVLALAVLDVVVSVLPAPAVAWVAAGLLMVAGFGNGFVISPNQTLTLAKVPPGDAGAAAGSLQTMQRIGAAVGVSANSAAFFAVLAATDDYGDAFAMSLRVVVGVMLLGLVVAIVDARRRSAKHEDATSG
ncbi:MFS transporter [Litorihabitans aurantiacus]|uniref:MFS transporter n=1 Tax=Litorihabitans aurantiacus TaxID=1930061 RepID=A0AA37UNH2_9MICO|nr:MFS transporter [Litorihabitans aurantiacus]GMA30191.1 MFS transporter [Litorihabitans aurantiacus]